MKSEVNKEFNEEQQEILKSIRVSRIILPILIGIGVVAYLMWQQFDAEDFAEIRKWTRHKAFWVGMAVVLLTIRHLAYALRLRVLTDKQFKWRKCIELIFIWEFSSAVSPTSVGGSAVALFVLAQEKLSTAKTTTLVLFSIVLDTIFFVGTLPILFLFYGPQIIRPNMDSIYDFDGWGYTFLGAYVLMAMYGSAFFYGLFVNPNLMKRLLVYFTRFRWLRRFRHQAIDLGNDLIVASEEMKGKRWPYFITAFLATATAWSCRFFLLNCLIIAFIPSTSLAIFDQMALYSRLETMFVVMAFSPTPGGAGLAELAFWSFTNDYVAMKSTALSIAVLWRLLTYYLYLFVGIIIIPNWIRNILNERKRNRLRREQEQQEKDDDATTTT